GDGLSRALGKRIDATRLCQCAAAGDWTSVPVALRLGCHGPGPSDGGGALRRAQSGVRALLVERAQDWPWSSVASASQGAQRRTRGRGAALLARYRALR